MAQLSTTFERDGYDGHLGTSQWWFEAWGSGRKSDWTRRADAGHPPGPHDLRSADYIVIGIRHENGQVVYRTHTGGLDLDPRHNRRKRH